MLLLLKTTQLGWTFTKIIFWCPKCSSCRLWFRNFAVPKFPFKVVSNIPYGITSDIFKILMFESLGNFSGRFHCPSVRTYTKVIFEEALQSIYRFLSYFFWFETCLWGRSWKFLSTAKLSNQPCLSIKRKQLFFDFKFKAKYLAFISCLLEKPDLSVKTALKSIFRKSQVRSISENSV